MGAETPNQSFYLYMIVIPTVVTSDRAPVRAFYSQPTPVLFPGCHQEPQIAEILISEFWGNQFCSQVFHFMIYLWFRVT